MYPNDRVLIWKAVKYYVMPLSVLTPVMGASEPTELQSGAESLGQYASPRELKEDRPFSGSSGEPSSLAASLSDAFVVSSATTDRKMRCNKNLSPLHHKRSTYSLTEQIDDAYVVFMQYRRQLMI